MYKLFQVVIVFSFLSTISFSSTAGDYICKAQPTWCHMFTTRSNCETQPGCRFHASKAPPYRCSGETKACNGRNKSECIGNLHSRPMGGSSNPLDIVGSNGCHYGTKFRCSTLYHPFVKNIKVKGGTFGREYLSVPGHGKFVDLWTINDCQGRQMWGLEKTSDGVSYNIIVVGGVDGNRKYLSTNGDGTIVDLWTEDDGSGRQRWIISGEHIKIKGGVSGNRKYLSVNPEGTKVDLWTKDDGSGRQKWSITKSLGRAVNL